MPFVAVAPCRIADTRGFGFTGAYGPPSLAPSETRTYTITGQCGIPADAKAVSFNFTVWNTASYGNLTVYPAGGAVPTVSTLNWPPGTLALANAAIVQLGTGGSAGQISVANQSSNAIDVFFDVNGYYTSLGIVNSVNGVSGNVSLPSLPPSGTAGGALAGSYPNPTLGAGQAVKSLNGLTDAVTLAPGTNITSIATGGNTLTINAATQPQAFSGYEMITSTSTMSGTSGVTTSGWVASYCTNGKVAIGGGGTADWAVPIMTQNSPLVGNNGKAVGWTVFWFKPSNYATTGNVAINLKGWAFCANVQ